MTEWTPPDVTPQAYPRTNRGLGMEAARNLRDQVNAARNEARDAVNSRLKAAGITITPAGMVIASDLTLDGTFTADEIIGNGALISPIEPESFDAPASNFAVPHAATNLATASLTIPADRTTAVVTADAVAVLACRDGGPDSLHFLIRIGTTDGPDTFRVYAAYDQFGESVGFSHTVTGLVPGGTLDVSARSWTGANDWPVWAANSARITGTVQWMR